MSVPSDRLFVQIDVDLLGLEIFLDAPWPQFPAESGLFVTTPRRLDVSWLHVIYPNNSRAQSFYHAKRLEDIARPNGCGQPVGCRVGDPQRFGFVRKRDDRRYRAKDFLLRDAGGIIHIVKNCGFDVITLFHRRWAASAGSKFRFLLAQFLIRAHSVELILAHQRAHLGLALERWPETNCFCFCAHRFHEFRIDGLLHQDAATCRADFSLIDENTEERSVNRRFEIRVGKKYVRRFAAQLRSEEHTSELQS